ncbi:MAG: response regulator transcription factor [Crocinitomicaceae bacterium]|nr:response regulator transcription factor [Crocinitomicaceae bacterium]
MDTVITVLIVDDHKLISEAWSSLLENAEGIQVIGTAESAQSAFDFALEHKPAIVLMDINLKDSNGFEATDLIYNKLAKTKIIGLSLHDDITLVKRFLSLGAKGYLTKNTSRTELVDAIHKVYIGEVYIANEIKDRFFHSLMQTEQAPPTKELTAKEIEIIKLIAEGLTSKEIAEQLFISHRTVETHRHNILKKLGIPNAALLSSWAKQKGYF